MLGNGNDGVYSTLDDQTIIVEDNYPLKTILSIIAADINVGDNLRLQVINQNLPQGTIIQVFCNGQVYYRALTKTGRVSIPIYDLPAGECPIIVMSEEAGDYEAGMNSTVIKVSKLDSKLYFFALSVKTSFKCFL